MYEVDGTDTEPIGEDEDISTMTMWTTRMPMYKSHFWTLCPEVVTCRQ